MYETETQIRSKAIEALKNKRRDEKGQIDQGRVESELADPRYSEWIAARIEDARRGKRLVTEKQHQDLRARREFQEGDKVRYIGPTVMKTSQVTGKGIMWTTGMMGTITKVQRGFGGRLVFTFLPDIDKKTREAAENGLDIEVLETTSTDWIDYERIG